MKHPKPDIGDSIRADFISNVSTIRKLLKYWGTTTVDGVPVLQQRQYYHPWSDDKEKLFRFLGMYDGVRSAKMDGITSAWIYFNKSREGVVEYTEDTRDFIVHNLNLMWWDPEDGVRPEGLTLTTSIVIEGEFQNSNTGSDESSSVSLSRYLDINAPTGTLINAITSNYEEVWNTALISQQGVGVINKGSIVDDVTKVALPDEDDLSQNDPWLETVARYALRTNGIPCTIKDVEIGVAQTETSSLYNTYVVTIEIPYIEVTSSMGLVTDIYTDIIADTWAAYNSVNRNKLTYPNGYYTQKAIRQLNIDDLETDPELVTRPYMFWSEVTLGAYESIWHKEGGYAVSRFNRSYTRSANYYIKVDALAHPRDYGWTYKELVNYLLPLLDTGYQKEKVPWWKKALAVIVFIVAVIFAPATGGGSLGLAKAVLFAVLVITALSFAFAQMGMTDWAMAFAEVNKMVEPLALVATVVLIVTGISAAIEAAKKAAAEAAAKGAADATIKEVIKELIISSAENVVDKILLGAQDLFTGQVSSASIGLLNKMADLMLQVQQYKLESINDRNKDLASEYERLTADEELESDILRGFANVYASPATADWSMYTALFDVPYEGSGGPLHLGCSQRTTKQALRKTKYEDQAFNEILII